MLKLVTRTVLIAVCGAALIAGCGSDDTTKKDAAPKDSGTDAPKDVATPDTAADVAIDTAVDVASDGAGGVDGGADAARDAAPADAGDGGGADAGLTAQQEHGRYLVQNVAACPDCHTPRNAMGAPIAGKFLSGAECFAQLPNGHCLHSRNLTSDETGLKNRSNDEIKKMIRDGLRPSAAGEVPLSRVMPYYVFHNMKDADLDDIVAYLRTVPAVNHAVPPSDVEFTEPAHVTYLDPAQIPDPPVTFGERESALRGKYLATQAGVCIECHSPHTAPAMPANPVVIDPTTFFQGGERFDLGFPVVPVSKNLTSDPTTGLGNWSAAEIIRAIKEGKDRDGKGICPPMPYGPMGPYGGLSAADTTDIANYIKSLPPKVNMIVDMCSFPFPPPPDGGAGDGGGDGGGDAGSDDAHD
jgi:cytochrome c553